MRPVIAEPLSSVPFRRISMRHVKRKAIAVFGAVVVASSALMAPPASADPPPPGVAFTVEGVNGQGCDLQSLTVPESASEFTVRYGTYQAWGGGGSTSADWVKRCQVVLRAQIPSGFTYAIAGVNYRGYAEQAAGARGLLRGWYSFESMTPSEPLNHLETGPNVKHWSVNTEVAETDLVFKPCGEDRLLYLDSELRVDAGQPTFMAMGTTADPAASNTVHLAWKSC
ncbi:DUF4360 domain-containing protein [Actinomadura chibensis]|uniref:DUF4360 domain-containing protein n=2 Tax=Actinomadura chibensis TaxID=392828 RepID=A0A5D0NVE9_9ACTN|nr:DUF4360 domain-containing protein [Actinomadura chibensis]